MSTGIGTHASLGQPATLDFLGKPFRLCCLIYTPDVWRQQKKKLDRNKAGTFLSSVVGRRDCERLFLRENTIFKWENIPGNTFQSCIKDYKYSFRYEARTTRIYF